MKTLIVGLGSASWQKDFTNRDIGTTHTFSIINFPYFSLAGGVDVDDSKRSAWEKEFGRPVDLLATSAI